MSAVKTRVQTMDSVVRILKNAKLIDGLSLDYDEVIAMEVPLFWHKRVDPGSPGIKKDTFVIWNIIGSSPIARADNDIARRSTYVALDIYTRKSESDKLLNDLLIRIEQEFKKEGWEFEQVAASDYDTTLQLNQIMFAATIKQ